ncbi:MAG TPA: general secretion pathway protein GspE [Planctomycetaceae bacterium]|nr:general secretion pathway protein GspE [Planctomycetaceae bacterium]
MELGQLLVDEGLVSNDQLQLARSEQNGDRIDQTLIRMGLVTEDAVLRTLSTEFGMAYIDLKDIEVDVELLSQFPTSAIFRHSLLPLYRQNGHVVVATDDPLKLEGLDELSTVSGLRLEPVLTRGNELGNRIRELLGVGGDTINELVRQRSEEGIELLEEIEEDQGELAEGAQAPSVIRLVNELLIEAVKLMTSDVHIEPQEAGLRVRYRIDGMLRVQAVPAEINHFYSAIVTRLKIMSHLNIAEKRLPQDGRIKLRVSGREVDVRVSIIPMVHGEGVVLRLLDKDKMKFDLKNVGMPPTVIRRFRQLIGLPHGIILVTGPTGSGKSTTLYSALNEIKAPETKIITVEDPVEYQMDGISQIQVHSRIGLTFAAGLRSILRHDPDVVLIGEIRDGETAQAAIQASLTGHVVFSTLHTNDAPSAFTRLVDMGVEPYLVASTVEGVLAQRLVRRLCPECKKAVAVGQADVPEDFPKEGAPAFIYEPNGCRECSDSGYSGRTGVFELLTTDPVLQEMCADNESATKIRKHALQNGMTTLRHSGWEQVWDGLTSVEEVVRITRGDIIA